MKWDSYHFPILLKNKLILREVDYLSKFILAGAEPAET